MRNLVSEFQNALGKKNCHLNTQHTKKNEAGMLLGMLIEQLLSLNVNLGIYDT